MKSMKLKILMLTAIIAAFAPTYLANAQSSEKLAVDCSAAGFNCGEIRQFVVADWDGDGIDDIVARIDHTSSDQIVVFEAASTGNYNAPTIVVDCEGLSCSNLKQIDVVDIDNDGRPEIFAREDVSGHGDKIFYYVTPNLIAHYTFEDTLNLGNDSAGNHNFATNGAGSTSGAVGNNAVDFDGTNDDLSDSYMTDSFYQFSDSDFTVSMFINADSSDTGFLFQSAEDSTDYFAIWIDGDNGDVVKVHMRDEGGSASQNLVGTTAINGSSGWHHIAVTRTGNDWELFVDGTSEDTESPFDADTTLTTSTARFGSSNGNAHYFDGAIDEVKIFDEAMIEAQIDVLCKESTSVTCN